MRTQAEVYSRWDCPPPSASAGQGDLHRVRVTRPQPQAADERQAIFLRHLPSHVLAGDPEAHVPIVVRVLDTRGQDRAEVHPCAVVAERQRLCPGLVYGRSGEVCPVLRVLDMVNQPLGHARNRVGRLAAHCLRQGRRVRGVLEHDPDVRLRSGVLVLPDTPLSGGQPQ